MKNAATRTSLLFALLFSTGCGSGSADAAIASLLPKDTVAVVRIASVDQLVKNARHATIAVGQDPQSIDANKLMGMLQALGGGKTALIDRTRPIAIAISMPGDTPSPVLMVPTTDAKAYAASLPPVGSPVVSGGYVVVPLGGRYVKARSPSTLMDSLPDGVVAVRADVEQLVTSLGSELGASLSALQAQMAREISRPGADGAALAESYVGGLRSVLHAAKTFEFGLDYREGQLDVFGELTVKPGSELAGWGADAVDLKSLASRLSGKSSFEVLMAADWNKLWPRLAPLLQSAIGLYPPQMRELLPPLFADYEQLVRALGPVVAADGDAFGSDGMSLVLHLAPPDATALQQRFEAMLGHESLTKMGISGGPAKVTDVAGASIRDYEVNVDFDKFAALSGAEMPQDQRDAISMALRALFGAGHLPLRLASKGGRTVIAIGAQRDPSATLASLDGKGDTKTGTESKPVQTALARFSDCNPLVVERVDFGAMMSGMARLAGQEAPPVPAGQSADFVIAGGVCGNEWRAQLSIDLKGFARMAQAMMPR
jgi:hypothetical protein